jgi:hypothetical protein
VWLSVVVCGCVWLEGGERQERHGEAWRGKSGMEAGNAQN